MDLNSFLGYGETLALLYGWTIVAAVVFSVVERVLPRRERAPETPPKPPGS